MELLALEQRGGMKLWSWSCSVPFEPAAERTCRACSGSSNGSSALLGGLSNSKAGGAAPSGSSAGATGCGRRELGQQVGHSFEQQVGFRNVRGPGIVHPAGLRVQLRTPQFEQALCPFLRQQCCSCWQLQARAGSAESCAFRASSSGASGAGCGRAG